MKCLKIIIVFCFLLNYALPVKAEITPKLEVSAGDLGYDEFAHIVYFEKIDSQYLGIVVEKLSGQRDCWIYDRYSKMAKTLFSDSDSLSIFFRFDEIIYFAEFNNLYNAGMSFFNKTGNTILAFVYERNEYGDVFKSYLLSYDISSFSSKYVQIGEGPQNWFFIHTEGKSYIFDRFFGDNFELFSYNDSTIEKVASIPVVGSENLDEKFFVFPFAYNGKIYISDQEKLYVFDTESLETKILIADTRGPLKNEFDIISAAVQYLVFNDEVYCVYSDIRLFYYFGPILFLRNEGNRIWKTDGTISGTLKIVDIPNESDTLNTLTYSKLFELNNHLYWIGDVMNDRTVSVYSIDNQQIQKVGSFEVDEKFDPYNYAYSFVGSLGNFSGFYSYYSYPLINNSMTVHLKGKEYVPYFMILPEDFNLNVGLLTIEDGNLVNLYRETPIVCHSKDSSDSKFTIEGMTVLELEDENLGYLIKYYSEDDSGYNNNQYLNLWLFDNILSDPIDSMNLFSTNGSYFNYFKDTDDLYFTFGDPSQEESSLWVINNDIPTKSIVHNYSDKIQLFTIFPNPSSQFFSIQSEENLDGIISIIGLDGKEYESQRVYGTRFGWDVSNLSNGMYLLYYQNDNTIAQGKFIIQS